MFRLNKGEFKSKENKVVNYRLIPCLGKYPTGLRIVWLIDKNLRMP